MAELVGRDDVESLGIELSELGRSLRESFHTSNASFRSISALSNGKDDDTDEELALQWAAIDKLPTFKRMKSPVFDEDSGNEADAKRRRVIDVTKLGALERHLFIEKLIRHVEHDNFKLLQKIRKRIDSTGIELPTVEVRYKDLSIEAKCQVVYGKPLPTLWNSFKTMLLDLARIPGLKPQESKISIVSDVSGVIKPGRLTLLLGPPGCGRTSLLKALSGNLDKSLKVSGEITYNGYKLTELVPQKTSAYISQYDMHIPEMTVRETLDFSSRCQGVGSRAAIMTELSKREKEAGILPDPDIDTYMKAISVEGQITTLQTDYILKILGLDICADTLVGDAMRRGISGGQKKRLTTGEMVVGPTRALFMDEISNGLDSSTTYQIVAYFQQLAHITDATILVSLLQPAPETFDLFDDIILMSEGKIVYHGPRTSVLEFFECCGFRCPERKGVADFLQEVISRKDQAQYWYRDSATYIYNSVDLLSRKFKESVYGKKLSEEVSGVFSKSKSQNDAISFTKFSIPKWTLFRACMSREYLLMKRNSFIYIFKSVQLVIIASVAMTVFLRTRMGVDVLHANYYLGALFYALVILLVDGFPELSLTVARLSIFYKQRELYFYPAWAYAIPSAILKVPFSLLEAVVWTSLTYYVIGYTPEVGRFFRQLILLFSMHLSSISMFRFIASVCRNVITSTAVGSLSMLFSLAFGGFIIARTSMPAWLRWGFWVCPLTYGEIGLALNEFLAPRWQKVLPSSNMTMGQKTLESRGLSFDGKFFWISVGALLGFALLFNIGFILALSFLNSPVTRAIISNDKLSQMKESSEPIRTATMKNSESNPNTTTESGKGKMVLPFEPLSVVFQNLQYYIDTPGGMKEHGYTKEKLQLLCDITGAFRPGILTALMGVSGAGKTTLLDVLAGRKTSGYVEGEIRIGGFPKVQRTFARISGYCEQTDIHSPQITVEESVIFSAWLRLHSQIDSKTKSDFVKEVLETIELDGIKDSLVGIPGVSGLSTEQRKRLTIAVELVANPSIIFMDEPTTGLDARAAAIVMRAIKNVADTGRTIVCTIHQPSIDIFESFDELLLLKSGGSIIYAGPLGPQSSKVIDYFEGISGVPKIKDNYNPATWMLEVTSTSSEAELDIDFAQIYRNSTLYQDNRQLVNRLSIPPSDSKVLHFPTRFPLNGWGQFKACLWKQYWSYWRSPSYNLNRFLHMVFTSLVFGALFWRQGKKLENQQSLFNILGAIFSAVLFCGINNSSSVLPYVSTERSVLYRERFAGMYASWAYALAQVTVEIPYILAQSLAYTIITYPMIGYYWSAYKVSWYFYTMFCTLLYFNYLGMLLIAITPSFPVAAILQSTFYTMFNLFAGFLVPRPQIPKWWIWFYYIIPTSWTLNGVLTSQYGDIEKEIEVFEETKTVAKFLTDYFGFHHNRLPIVAVVLALYPIIFATLFAYCIGKLNFQKR
ncbi:pleiotropic drug resistance protein 3-like isoform X1 [Coffea eugenioides]|uniref:pleiotropic drug resistance protein 3-like isoform X1 n=1 Tax=Coffea eugenioides TaxID=49369 RepID=UPI000F612B61|nr:pleiotropic drug resistance protein 3-like isoform X1 [Coffea eugenioides]